MKLVIWLIVSATPFLFTGCSSTYELMPTPRLYCGDVKNPFDGLPPELCTLDMPILYATDRQATQKESRIAYTAERGYNLKFGKATVRVINCVNWRTLALRSVIGDDRDDVDLVISQVRQTGEYPKEAVFAKTDPKRAEIEKARAEAAFRELVDAHPSLGQRKEALVYVHGFNTSFENAVVRLAGLWHYMGRQYVPVLYSWPSGRDGLFGYASEYESSDATVDNFKRFIQALAATKGLDKVHVIAHSRGADVILRAMMELNVHYSAQNKHTGRELKFGQLVLAAPDLDMYLVRQRYAQHQLSKIPEHVTVYTSQEDRAINFSIWIHGGYLRLGALTPKALASEELKQIGKAESCTIIENRAGKRQYFGHSYVVHNPEVSSDLILLLKDGKTPGKDGGRPLEPTETAPNVWLLRKGYPAF